MSMSLYFDAKDHELLKVVNRFLRRDSLVPQDEADTFFHPSLHPHGIKELAVSQEIRVAYAVINLLDSLEGGHVRDRINALQALHDEVLYSASSSFRHNTGRVLIQIMKSLIRAHGDTEKQLRLAHDFRKAASGRRRFIRKMLQQYYLLEMPEEWNQLSFDCHVHDANTKGRKSPTHLIMDAWIKGIRSLDVLYYNFVEPDAVSELMQAAAIMSIRVRIGIEFMARFRDRHVQFVWEPSGFLDAAEMVDFLNEKPTQHLMRMGREASQYHHDFVIRLLENYNERLRFELGRQYGVNLPLITHRDILSLVGIGQTSRTHLAELIYRDLIRAFESRMDSLRESYAEGGEGRDATAALVRSVDALSAEDILEDWLCEEKNPEVPLPRLGDAATDVPEIMRLLPMTLIDWLTSIRTPCNIILNLNKLSTEDVLELLYECEGMVTHLEIFNLKNFHAGDMKDIKSISELQAAINEGSPVALKRLIRNIIQRESKRPASPARDERSRLFKEILRNIPRLQGFYASKPLRAIAGTDSTSRSTRIQGMGFVFPETLPIRAQKAIHNKESLRESIPIYQEVYRHNTYFPKRHLALGKFWTAMLRKIPGMANFGTIRKEAWRVNDKVVAYKEKGNIATLGGFQKDLHPGLQLSPKAEGLKESPGLDYMNTSLKNILKVALGFALTVATFAYTQTWWVLAWFGPCIWFGITGFRNIVQAILAGSGIRRNSLLRWNDYISWTRLCDSLLFTGISVPLLELGVRLLLLEKICDIDSLSHPVLFYTVLSIINGIYISGHNLLRGLPKEAVIGNLFRSILAIPVSVFYGFCAYEIVVLGGFDAEILVQGGTVISKLASDSVASIIEGLADKVEYLRARHWDYKAKISQLYDCFSRLEILLPEEDVSELLRRPKDFIRTIGKEAEDLEKTIIVNALDLMYFWMYQPRARSTFIRMFQTLTREEREILVNAQMVLTRVHEISQMLVDGLAGNNFARPLAFYLARHEEYLNDIAKATGYTLTIEEAA